MKPFPTETTPLWDKIQIYLSLGNEKALKLVFFSSFFDWRNKKVGFTALSFQYTNSQSEATKERRGHSGKEGILIIQSFEAKCHEKMRLNPPFTISHKIENESRHAEAPSIPNSDIYSMATSATYNLKKWKTCGGTAKTKTINGKNMTISMGKKKMLTLNANAGKAIKLFLAFTFTFREVIRRRSQQSLQTMNVKEKSPLLALSIAI